MSHAGTRRTDALRNYIAYALVFLCLVAVHFIIAANPGSTKSVAQAAVFSWNGLAIVGAAGLFGVFFLNLTRLRGFWDADLGWGATLGVPVLVGLVIGAADLAADLKTGWTKIIAAQMHLTTIHIAWPLSVPIYFGGAIFVTIVYFLVLIPFLDWLIARKLLKDRGEAAVYWIVAALLAFVEPLTQGDIAGIQSHGWQAVPEFAGDLALNIGQVFFLRRSGFVAAVALRVGYYAVWHVLYGLMG